MAIDVVSRGVSRLGHEARAARVLHAPGAEVHRLLRRPRQRAALCWLGLQTEEFVEDGDAGEGDAEEGDAEKPVKKMKKSWC